MCNALVRDHTRDGDRYIVPQREGEREREGERGERER